jgi:hypothetical protein
VAELKPLADASESLRVAKEKAESEASEWSRVCKEAIEERRALQEKLSDERKNKNELKKTYDEKSLVRESARSRGFPSFPATAAGRFPLTGSVRGINQELDALQKKVDKMETDAKFDKQAREGQVHFQLSRTMR